MLIRPRKEPVEKRKLLKMEEVKGRGKHSCFEMIEVVVRAIRGPKSKVEISQKRPRPRDGPPKKEKCASKGLFVGAARRDINIRD